MNDFGLPEQDIDLITSVFETFPEIMEAYIFGSRAKGNYKKGSDVDIALKGENLTLQLISTISYSLNEETNLPYKFDILNFHSIKNSELTDHINRVGVCIFSRKTV